MCYRVLDAADDPGVVWRPPIRAVSSEFKSCPSRRRAPGRTRALDNCGRCSAPFTSASLVEQCEGPQRHPVRHLAEVGIAGAFRIDAADAADHCHILLAILLPGHRLADDAGWRLEAPQHL